MKSVELQIVAKKFCQHQHRFLKKIPGSFCPEDIHQFRVAFKKLRALLRLINPAVIHSRELGVPASLLSLYHVAGTVRDLQVNIPFLTDAFARNNVQASSYFTKLEEDLSDAKKGLRAKIEESSFKKHEHQIIDAITTDLEEYTIREFVHRKVATIQILLLGLSDDDDIHSIRKHIKDILYSIRIFEHDWHIPFPIVAWENEERLENISTQLGDYCDRCEALAFLKYGLDLKPSRNETATIQIIQEILQQEKNAEMKKLIAQLHELNLISDFDR
ncbi:MAG TPA: CHAD domain-containing protein [Flavitalea sp.]|nr:CHAD domain-containing protein [Flavitalea sp.]